MKLFLNVLAVTLFLLDHGEILFVAMSFPYVSVSCSRPKRVFGALVKDGLGANVIVWIIEQSLTLTHIDGH